MPIKRFVALQKHLAEIDIFFQDAIDIVNDMQNERQKMRRDILSQNRDLDAYASGDITDYDYEWCDGHPLHFGDK